MRIERDGHQGRPVIERTLKWQYLNEELQKAALACGRPRTSAGWFPPQRARLVAHPVCLTGSAHLAEVTVGARC